jgi:hypothetical protein
MSIQHWRMQMWHWDSFFFFSEYFSFPLSISTNAKLKRKSRKKNLIIFIIFITGLHNKSSTLRCVLSICYGAFQKKIGECNGTCKNARRYGWPASTATPCDSREQRAQLVTPDARLLRLPKRYVPSVEMHR